jgi:hypothetical protein
MSPATRASWITMSLLLSAIFNPAAVSRATDA